MNKKEIEKIEVERDFYNIMSNYGKLGYKINKITDELNEISKLADLVAKEKKEYEDRIQKAIEYITNNFADIDYMKSRYSEQVINTHIAEIPTTDIEKLLDILKGGDLDE